MGHDVFISHSSKDRQVAHAACATLEARGHRCWIAPRDIPPGSEWGEAIVDGIRGARVFVLIFSANANFSQQVRREVERAAGHELPIVPFRIEEVAPARSLEYFISNQHWLDAMTPPMERHLERLADAVGRLLAGPGSAEAPAPAPRAAQRRPKKGWAVAAIAAALLGVAAAVGYAVLPDRGEVADAGNGMESNDMAPATEALEVASPTAPMPLQPVIDFARIGVEPGAVVDAASHLRQAEVSIDAYVSPSAARLVMVSGTDLLYRASWGTGGFEEVDLSSRAVLALQSQSDAPATIELVFAEPLREVRLTSPQVSPRASLALSSYTAFPPMTLTALAAGGRLLVEQHYPPYASRDLSSPRQRTMVATAPGEEGIRTLRLRVEGAMTTDISSPYAAASALRPGEVRPPPPPPPFNPMLVIDGIVARRMPSGN